MHQSVIRKMILAAVVSVALSPLTDCFPEPPERDESVAEVHGRGRTTASLAVLVSRIEATGYRVVRYIAARPAR